MKNIPESKGSVEVVKMGPKAVIHTPESFLKLVSVYKRKNPVKFAAKEESFKKKFVALGGESKDFVLISERSRAELEKKAKDLPA